MNKIRVRLCGRLKWKLEPVNGGVLVISADLDKKSQNMTSLHCLHLHTNQIRAKSHKTPADKVTFLFS